MDIEVTASVYKFKDDGSRHDANAAAVTDWGGQQLCFLP